jgi:hypothetical protein
MPRPDQDAFESGAFLHVNDPWPAAFSLLDRALFEDAKRVHHKKLITEITALATAWKEHTEHCSLWVSEMSFEILDASKMNPSTAVQSPDTGATPKQSRSILVDRGRSYRSECERYRYLGERGTERVASRDNRKTHHGESRACNGRFDARLRLSQIKRGICARNWSMRSLRKNRGDAAI